ncbi:hypothetical protein [Neotabrizicola sp. sgz301269]|uniref:hypothetical protein n=1 Tax=Neotabrizicola sp. sgz301269 TaxID=3276282 RepID=UPI00376FC277
MKEVIERFTCRDDDGQTYDVLKRQNISTYQPISGPPRRVKGTIDFVLSNGMHLNASDDETEFTIVQTDKKIRKY